MKTALRVKICVCCLLGIILVACKEYEPPTSHFGTGRHHCYYQNIRTARFYEGEGDKPKEAIRNAYDFCREDAVDDNDKMRCSFAECRFR